MNVTEKLDRYDLKILAAVAEEGRLSWRDLAEDSYLAQLGMRRRRQDGYEHRPAGGIDDMDRLARQRADAAHGAACGQCGRRADDMDHPFRLVGLS
mgnify:CR=1 FL=1